MHGLFLNVHNQNLVTSQFVLGPVPVWIQTVLPRYGVSNQLLFYSWGDTARLGKPFDYGFMRKRWYAYLMIADFSSLISPQAIPAAWWGLPQRKLWGVGCPFLQHGPAFPILLLLQKCSDHVVANQTLNVFLPWHLWKDSGQLPRSLWAGKARRGEVEPLCRIWYESLGPSPQKTKSLDHLLWVF